MSSLISKEALCLDDAQLVCDLAGWQPGEDVARAYEAARKQTLKAKRPVFPRRRSVEPLPDILSLWQEEPTRASPAAFFDWLCDVFGGTDELLHVVWFHLTSESIKIFLGRGIEAAVAKARELGNVLGQLRESVGSLMHLESMEAYTATMAVLSDVNCSRKVNRKLWRRQSSSASCSRLPKSLRPSSRGKRASLLVVTDYFWPEAKWDAAVAFSSSKEVRRSPHLLFESMRIRPREHNCAFIRSMTPFMREHDPRRAASALEASKSCLRDQDCALPSLPLLPEVWNVPVAEFRSALAAVEDAYSDVVSRKRVVLFPSLATVEVKLTLGSNKSVRTEFKLRLPLLQATLLSLLARRTEPVDVADLAAAARVPTDNCRHELAALVRLKLVKVEPSSRMLISFRPQLVRRESTVSFPSNDTFGSGRTSLDVLTVLNASEPEACREDGAEVLVRTLVISCLRASMRDATSSHVGFQPFRFWKLIESKLQETGVAVTYADFGKVLSVMMDEGIVENRGGLYTLAEDFVGT